MKIAVLGLLLFQVSAPGPENWAYVTCMISSSEEVLERAPSRAEFQRRLMTMCKREEEAQRQAILRKQLGEGRSRAQAEADAEEFFAEIRSNMLALLP